MRGLFFCLLLIGIPCWAGSGDAAWLSGFSSHHSKNGSDLRGNNFGQGYRNADGYAVLGYRNSFDGDSLFVGREFLTKGNPSAGVIVGAVTGYPMRAVTPVALPEVFYRMGRVGLAVIYLPAPSKKYVSAVALQVRYAMR